jgi:signal peptide peptidase SppA
MCHMNLLDIVTSPWAIQPERLVQIREIYAARTRGQQIDIAAVEAQLGRPLDNEARRYEVVDGVAVLPIEGVIAKRANLFVQISGGTSSELVARDLRAALADAEVHSIILAIDSPGGTVDGTEVLANLVLQARERKPVVALANGAMASAAYWIGSAAGKVYIADGTTQVGSIGVVATHVDVSGAELQRGVRTTEVYAGKYKRIASQYAPLSDSGRATMQEKVDYTYGLFVEAVAAHRGVHVDKVLSDMADGRVFIGQQAISAGLVDGVATLDALIEQLNRTRTGQAGPSPSGPPARATDPASSPPQTLEQRCRADFEANADLRAEFGTVDRFIAYSQAVQSGRARILGGAMVRSAPEFSNSRSRSSKRWN